MGTKRAQLVEKKRGVGGDSIRTPRIKELRRQVYRVTGGVNAVRATPTGRLTIRASVEGDGRRWGGVLDVRPGSNGSFKVDLKSDEALPSDVTHADLVIVETLTDDAPSIDDLTVELRLEGSRSPADVAARGRPERAGSRLPPGHYAESTDGATDRSEEDEDVVQMDTYEDVWLSALVGGQPEEGAGNATDYDDGRLSDELLGGASFGDFFGVHEEPGATTGPLSAAATALAGDAAFASDAQAAETLAAMAAAHPSTVGRARGLLEEAATRECYREYASLARRHADDEGPTTESFGLHSPESTGLIVVPCTFSYADGNSCRGCLLAFLNHAATGRSTALQHPATRSEIRDVRPMSVQDVNALAVVLRAAVVPGGADDPSVAASADDPSSACAADGPSAAASPAIAAVERIFAEVARAATCALEGVERAANKAIDAIRSSCERAAA